MNQARQTSDALPETVVSALISASDEIAQRETWAVPRQGGTAAIVPRIISVLCAAQARMRPEASARRFVRQSALRVLAYLPVDLRLGALIEMSAKAPEALDDLFYGDISPDYEIYRYNTLTALGTFARHGLVEEVFSEENIIAVGQAIGKTRSQTRQRKGEQA